MCESRFSKSPAPQCLKQCLTFRESQRTFPIYNAKTQISPRWSRKKQAVNQLHFPNNDN